MQELRDTMSKPSNFSIGEGEESQVNGINQIANNVTKEIASKLRKDIPIRM